MKFRPCIDLHKGQVKQIVGSTLIDGEPERLETNFTAHHPPEWYARLYRADKLTGGHIIMLGSGNDDAAIEALAAWPGGMQIGGGISAENAALWLDRGASHVIITSWVFREGFVDSKRLHLLRNEIGSERLVLDLSCRRRGDDYFIVTDRWQTFTEVKIGNETLTELANYCNEFLIHAADVEGKCSGVDTDLVKLLGELTPIPTTYAGGIRDLADLEVIRVAGQGKLDATIGSALDIFGGHFIRYDEVVKYHRKYSRNV